MKRIWKVRSLSKRKGSLQKTNLNLHFSLDPLVIFALAGTLSDNCVWSTEVCSVSRLCFPLYWALDVNDLGMKSRGKPEVWNLHGQTAVYHTALARPNNQCETWSWIPRLWSCKIASNLLLLCSQAGAEWWVLSRAGYGLGMYVQREEITPWEIRKKPKKNQSCPFTTSDTVIKIQN